MPIYEYKCGKCGVFEAMQGIKEAPLKKCPTCKGKVERQISRGSFILKGSGWYATDYGKKGTASSTESESSASASTNGSTTESKASDSKAESKPAASESGSASKPKASESKSSEKSAAAKAAD